MISDLRGQHAKIRGEHPSKQNTDIRDWNWRAAAGMNEVRQREWYLPMHCQLSEHTIRPWMTSTSTRPNHRQQWMNIREGQPDMTHINRMFMWLCQLDPPREFFSPAGNSVAAIMQSSSLGKLFDSLYRPPTLAPSLASSKMRSYGDSAT